MWQVLISYRSSGRQGDAWEAGKVARRRQLERSIVTFLEGLGGWHTFFLNTLGVGLCFFSLIAGALQRYFHNYKWVQLAGICMRAIGMGLVFFATGEHATDVNLVMAQVMISLGVSLEFSLRAG